MNTQTDFIKRLKRLLAKTNDIKFLSYQIVIYGQNMKETDSRKINILLFIPSGKSLSKMLNLFSRAGFPLVLDDFLSFLIFVYIYIFFFLYNKRITNISFLDDSAFICLDAYIKLSLIFNFISKLRLSSIPPSVGSSWR